MEERRFVCKYCFKRFPCGKSLGGHIRTHMTQERNHHNNNNVAHDDDSDMLLNLDDERKNNKNKKRDSWAETVAGSTNYGLRENPRKTMRFVYPDHAAAAAYEL